MKEMHLPILRARPLGPAVDFDLDASVTLIYAPSHRQPISKLEKIKEALDTYQTTGQLVRVPQPTEWISNMVVRLRAPTAYQTRKNTNFLRTLSNHQSHTASKVHHSTLE